MINKKGDIHHDPDTFDDDPEELLWNDDSLLKPLEDDKYERMLTLTIESMSNDSVDSLPRLINALAWFGNEERLLPVLLKLFEDPVTRIYGIKGIGITHLSGGLDALIDTIEDSPESKKEEIIEAIISIGKLETEEGTSLLYDIMCGYERPDIEEADLVAVESLLRIAEREENEDGMAWKALLHGAKSDNSDIAEA